MNLKSKTFCVLPWIEKCYEHNGLQYLCCQSRTPVKDSELNSIREQLKNQEFIPHCKFCYDLEKQKAISPRLLETSRWLKNTEVKSYIDNWKQGQQEKTFFYDIRFSNKCNLACIPCNPTNSSLWANELGIKVETQSHSFDINDVVSSKKIYLAGGEPLITEQCIDLLQRVAEQQQQPEVIINTNFTRNNDQIQQILKNIKNLTLVVSVDAYKHVNEYHRWPMSWNKFIENLDWAQDIGCTIEFNSVIDAVSIINAADLVEIESRCNFWNLAILTTPAALAINNLPDHVKPAVQASWEKIKTSRFYTSDPVFKSRVDHSFDLLKQSGHSELLANYIATIDQRRNIDHQTYLGIKLT